MNASDVNRRILWVAEYTVYTRGFAARLAEGRRWLNFKTYKLPRGDHDLGIAPKTSLAKLLVLQTNFAYHLCYHT